MHTCMGSTFKIVAIVIDFIPASSAFSELDRNPVVGQQFSYLENGIRVLPLL